MAQLLRKASDLLQEIADELEQPDGEKGKKKPAKKKRKKVVVTERGMRAATEALRRAGIDPNQFR